jgi:fluoride ion exporter CrcB/FEX
MGRVLLYIVPSFGAFILGIAGVKLDAFNAPVNLALFTVPALLVPLAVFIIVTEFTSFAAHFRRLADARRPTWLAIIVLVPMFLGLLAYAAGTQAGAAQHRAMNAPPVAKEATEAKEGEAAPAKAKKPPPRRGPPGPPQSERQMAVATGMGMGVPIWALTSFGVMLWTLLYVARLPNGGRGRFRTGSDLTAEEIEAGA